MPAFTATPTTDPTSPLLSTSGEHSHFRLAEERDESQTYSKPETFLKGETFSSAVDLSIVSVLPTVVGDQHAIWIKRVKA